MEKCVFCQIVAGQKPAYKIYEDDRFLAFLDKSPYTSGHTLVIPKNHYRWVWEVPDIEKYFQLANKIARHYQQVLNNNWITGFIWGLDVPHAHIHLLPSPTNLQINWPREKLTEEKAKALVKKLALS